MLQLFAHAPLALNNDGKRLSLKVPAEGEPPRELELGRSLGSPTGWRMVLPKGCTLLWPHLPWNPYRPPTYREPSGLAVAMVRVPLRGPRMRAEVVVNVHDA